MPGAVRRAASHATWRVMPLLVRVSLRAAPVLALAACSSSDPTSPAGCNTLAVAPSATAYVFSGFQDGGAGTLTGQVRLWVPTGTSQTGNFTVTGDHALTLALPGTATLPISAGTFAPSPVTSTGDGRGVILLDPNTGVRLSGVLAGCDFRGTWSVPLGPGSGMATGSFLATRQAS